MKETLYVRFLTAPADGEVEYAVVAADGDPRHLAAQRGPLDAALDLAAGRRLIVFVPAADVRFAKAQVPAKQPSKVLQAVPYALEDQVADDIDTLHFAVGPRQADGAYPVAIVGRDLLDRWVAPLRARGVRPESVTPETLALPVDADPSRWSGLADGTYLAVRSGAWSGFACDASELGAWLDVADVDRVHSVRLFVAGEAQDFSAPDRPIDLMPGYASGLAVLASGFHPETAINLLQGSQAQGRNVNHLWQPWRIAAALVAAWLIVGGTAFALDTWQLDHEVQRQDAANAERFQALFPNQTRIVNLDAQLDQEMRALAGGGNAGGLLVLLDATTQALAANQGIRITALQFRDNNLYLSMTGPSLEALEGLRNWFAAGNRGGKLDVQTADQEGGVVQIRATVKPS